MSVEVENMNDWRNEMKKVRHLSIVWALFLGWGVMLTLCVNPIGAEEDTHDHQNHVEKQEPDSHKIEDDHEDHERHAEHDADAEEHGDDQGGHEKHAEDDDEEGLRLTPEQRRHFEIVVRQAGPGALSNELSLPGEIVFNEDRVVHLVPRLSGIVRKVNKTVGDRVAAGEIMAVIDSRELADAKAEYMASLAREDLAGRKFKREQTLYEKKISSEQDFLNTQQALAEARIELRSAEQKLHTLGFSEKYMKSLSPEHDATITRYEIKAPFSGVVTDKHISLGESLKGDTDIFTVADLSSVWVNLTVYLKDLEAVCEGQEVNLKVAHSGLENQGKISMITPFVDEATRSATARIVIDNVDGQWRPGTFVTGHINLSEENIAVVIPRDAVQMIKGKSIVFVEEDGVFKMVPVQIGRSDRTHVEIVGGLKRGAPYVVKGAFALKTTIVTSNIGSHAGHGH